MASVEESDAGLKAADTDNGKRTMTTDKVGCAVAKLFVGGLAWQTTAERLRDYFAQFGTINDVLVMKDPITQRSRGFGFITFARPESVELALSSSSHILDGKKIDPKYATPKSRSRANKTKKIFVGGVSQDTSAEEVRSYFENFGVVEDSVMLMDQQTKRHRGFGFVTFDTEESVDRVCAIHFHTIKNKKVECKRAMPKESVQAANSGILNKRVMLNNFGTNTANPNTLRPLNNQSMSPALLAAAAAASQLQTITAAAMAAQTAAANNAAAAAAAATAAGLPKMAPPNALMGSSVSGPNGGGGGGGGLSSLRYSPYSIPALGNSQQQVQHQQQLAAAMILASQQQQQMPGPPPLSNAANTAAPQTSSNTTSSASSSSSLLNSGGPNGGVANTLYPGYNLANIDMSGFQGVDWNAVYGVGGSMYV